MPPHCDSLDGPVVSAARHPLEADDARDVADRLFFETVVRLHRAGEGAPYNGLKPAGLDVGPVIPLAEKAVANGDLAPLSGFLATELHRQLEHRLAQVGMLAAARDRSTADARAWVGAMLGFEVYSHQLLKALHASPHGEGEAHSHE